MKKLYFLAVVVIGMTLASCSSTTPVAVTSNPVGNKCGEATSTRFLTIFGGSSDMGINKAAKNGGITRISHVDSYSKNYLLWQTFGVRVYGE